MHTRYLLALCLLLLTVASLAAAPAEQKPQIIAQAVASARAPVLTSVSNLGGVSRAVAVDQGMVYLLESSNFVVIDARDAALPRVVASLPLSGPGRDIFVSSGLAYLAMDAQGLLIIDVHDPNAPVFRSRIVLPGIAQAVHVAGATAYVAAGTGGLQILDVSDPARPNRRGSFITGDARDLFVTGSYAYLADGNSGLHTIDVRDAAQPALRATHQAQEVQAVSVVGTRAYILAQSGSNRDGTPYITAQVATVPLAPGAALPAPGATSSCLQVLGSFLYTCGSIYTLQNPDQPAGNIGYGAPGQLARGPITVADGLVYMAGAGVQIIDVRNFTSPQLRGATRPPAYAHEIDRSGNLLYVADLFHGWQIIDVADPTRPRVVSWDPFQATRIRVVGNRAYVGGIALRIYDVSNPARPALLSSYGVANGTSALEVTGTRAYVVDLKGLSIVDVSDPANIRLLSQTNPPQDSPRTLAVAGDLVYLVTRSGLQIYDVTSPTAPVLRGTLALSSTAPSLRVVGSRVYLSDLAGLRIVDVQNPDAPQLLGSYVSNVRAYQADVAGDIALLATDRGMQLVDVSDPTAPVLRNDVLLPGGAWSVRQFDGLIFSGSPRAHDGQGLRIMRLLQVTNQLYLPQLGQ